MKSAGSPGVRFFQYSCYNVVQSVRVRTFKGERRKHQQEREVGSGQMESVHDVFHQFSVLVYPISPSYVYRLFLDVL